MTHLTDYFFLHVKSIYHNFPRPSEIEEEIWDEMLSPYNVDEIKTAIKAYRKSEDGVFAPVPSKFTPHLRHIKRRKQKPEPQPFSPEHYFMQEDIKNHRCKYLYPVYVDAAKYTLFNMLDKVATKKELKDITYEQRYNLAVEYGLFDYFQHTLNLVASERRRGEANA
jgi:hypothetical protein